MAQELEMSIIVSAGGHLLITFTFVLAKISSSQLSSSTTAQGLPCLGLGFITRSDSGDNGDSQKVKEVQDLLVITDPILINHTTCNFEFDYLLLLRQS